MKDLIPSPETLHFVNLDTFNKQNGPNSIDYQRICDILNQANGPLPSLIIADPSLYNVLKDQLIHSVHLPVPGKPLFLYTSTAHKHSLIKATDNAKTAFLKGLGSPIKGMHYNYWINNSRLAKRYAIPALTDYSALAVDRLRYGLARPANIRTYWIIAPFIREEDEKRKELSKAGFVELITSSEVFTHVVEYVIKNSISKETITEKQIIADYQRLLEDYYDVMENTDSSN